MTIEALAMIKNCCNVNEGKYSFNKQKKICKVIEHLTNCDLRFLFFLYETKRVLSYTKRDPKIGKNMAPLIMSQIFTKHIGDNYENYSESQDRSIPK